MTQTEREGHWSGPPVIFGEVLFDCFDDGAFLGGAPFNVAWHLQGFGLNPLFISRVGEDTLGDQVLAAMTRWGMETTGMQRDPVHPTGTVRVRLEDGQPRFDIVAGSAYDYIALGPAREALSSRAPALLYHGTLATRQPVSSNTLQGLKSLALPRFVDVNLRAPWWSREALIGHIDNASWVKLNDTELGALVGGEAATPGDLETAAREACRAHGIGLMILTRGAAGALLVESDSVQRAAPVPVSRLVDTVGAGDAFSAVAILGLLSGWSRQLILARATAFASAVCAIRGAVSTDPDFYARQLSEWKA